MLFRKTHGNFCFKKCYGVSLFHLGTGNMGRGNDGKRFSLFAGQFAHKEENWEVSFSVKALANASVSSAVAATGGVPLTRSSYGDFCKSAQERGKSSEMGGTRATVCKSLS